MKSWHAQTFVNETPINEATVLTNLPWVAATVAIRGAIKLQLKNKKNPEQFTIKLNLVDNKKVDIIDSVSTLLI